MMSSRCTFVATPHTIRSPASAHDCLFSPTSSNARQWPRSRRRIRTHFPGASPIFGSRITRPFSPADSLSSSVLNVRIAAHEMKMSSAPPTTGNKSSHEDVESRNQSESQPMGLLYVSWSEVEQMSRKVVEQTIGMKFDLVLAITRGGLTPAGLICEALHLRNILTVTVIYYSEHGKPFYGLTEPRFLSFPPMDALEGRSVLIIDDVWDSGLTARTVRSRVLRAHPRNVKVAVLHFKPDCNQFAGDAPDFYAETTNDWIFYPWESMSKKAPSCDSNLSTQLDSSESSSALPDS